MPEFLSNQFFSNTVFNYFLFLIIFVISCVVIRIVGLLLIRHLHKLADKTENTFDDLLMSSVTKYLLPVLYFLAFYLSTKVLYLNATLDKIMNTCIWGFVIIIAAIFISAIAGYFLSVIWKNKIKRDNNELAFKLLMGIARILIWGVVLILFLDNIGVKITSLVAGFGIGGVAVAFAAQSILTDIFCFFTIFFDKPFEIGDFIISKDQMGTVEHIGIKTTRLRSLNGEQLIFSNTELTNSRISNYKTMSQRRVLFSIGVTYDTSHEKLREIPELIKNIIESVPETVFGRTHFNSYGAFSLNFEIAYYILSDDYDKYMDINQEINLLIKEVLDKKGIQFAFPTQSIQLQNISASANSK